VGKIFDFGRRGCQKHDNPSVKNAVLAAFLPAPFTQGSLSFYRNCPGNGNFLDAAGFAVPGFLFFLQKNYLHFYFLRV